jgi:succinate-semialdehyde dehydrogenase/glutarate-semialdehyde dehydrogenase
VKWNKTSYQQRADLLHKVATFMRANNTSKTITLEMGKLLPKQKEKSI